MESKKKKKKKTTTVEELIPIPHEPTIKEKVIEALKDKGYNVSLDNSVVMFYGDYDYDEIKQMLEDEYEYNYSWGVVLHRSIE